MALTITFSVNGRNIHQGPGFLFHNILRPLLNMRALTDGSNPPNYVDPAAPAAWAATTAYAQYKFIKDTNNNVQVATTGGTSGATAPTWNTAVGGTTTDATVTWTNAGPTWVWTASNPIPVDTQVRDTNNNIQQAIVAGTTGATQPTWPTALGAITTDGTVQWMNLGPTIAMGALEGALQFQALATTADIEADQYTAPLDAVITKETGKIDGTLKELDLAKFVRAVPSANYASATADPALPTGAQAFEEILMGGTLRVPTPAIMLASPERQYVSPTKCVVGVLLKSAAKGNAALGFTRLKPTEWKAEWDGLAVTYRPAGFQVLHLYRQT